MRARYAGPQRTPKHEVRRTTPRFLVIWQVGSLLPLPALRFDVQGLPHPLLSGPSVRLGSSCGQRETASMCRPSQKAGALLGPFLPHRHPPHPVSRSCLFSLSSLPQASVTFFLFFFLMKKEKKETTTPSPFQPPPPPSLYFTNKHLE